MRFSVWSKAIRLVLAVAFLLVPTLVWAGEAAVDLVGRNGKFQVKDRTGNVQDISESSLRVNADTRQQASPPSKKAAKAEAPAEGAAPPAGEAGAAAPEGVGETGSTPAAGTPEGEPTGVAGQTDSTKPGPEGAKPEATVPAEEKPKEETPEEKAARAADIRAVRAMLQQGGAYFYGKDKKPLTNEQVEQFLRAGKLDEIQATGLHLESWSSEAKALKDKNAGKAAARKSVYTTGSASDPDRRTVHEVVADGKPLRDTVKDNKPFDPKAYNSGVPEDGQPSPLAIPEERRPFSEVTKDNKPFDPKRDLPEEEK
ncbi:MAG: hypothetical protein IT365_09320 [Candidatus Hydrogenedentes bacterium]|nr:hypothetical protein [Candidatus Hydrogenedentota bacterium]